MAAVASSGVMLRPRIDQARPSGPVKPRGETVKRPLDVLVVAVTGGVLDAVGDEPGSVVEGELVGDGVWLEVGLGSGASVPSAVNENVAGVPSPHSGAAAPGTSVPPNEAPST